MAYREPTFDEIYDRTKRARIVLCAFVYLVLGYGGTLLFDRLVTDPAWIEIFHETWWLPSCAASYFAAHFATFWIISPVKDEG